MLKIAGTLLFLFFCLDSDAQCPYISGALIDADASGAPTGEGKNEFVAFNTGGSSVAANTVFISYAISTTTTNFSLNGTLTSPSIWTSLVSPSLITNSSGTITVVSSTGTIPANKNVVVIASTNTISYDLKTFGTDVYVLPYNIAAGSPRVVGYTAAGNFANSGGTNRYFRISVGLCRDTVSFIPSSLPGADGGGAKWNSAGVITYYNTGSSGAVLPVNLISAKAFKEKEKTILEWKTAGNSSAVYFEIEKSLNGSSFTKVGTVIAESAQFVEAKAYSFKDEDVNDQAVFYRLRLVDKDNSHSFSPVMRLVERQSSGKSRIFPNPASSQIFIETVNNDNYNYVIKDFSGKVLAGNNFSGGSASINIETLPSGCYFLQLIGSGDIETHKIIRE